jgi:hypothetical protein
LKVIMFITLTNATAEHKGKPIAIRKDLIVTVYSSVSTLEDGKKKTSNFVYAPPHGTWEVKEKVEDIVEQLNGV